LEVCHASVRAGAPAGEPVVEYLCIRPDSGKPAGETCIPAKLGVDCQSGFCAHTTLPGVGFCARTCKSDGQCNDLGGGSAVCAERVVIPGASTEMDITVSQCRVIAECVDCLDDRDCGPGLRCVDLSSIPYLEDLRCVNACETDDDCLDLGDGLLCTDLPAPYETSPDGTARACAPVVCPG